jgi:hypothetical protein
MMKKLGISRSDLWTYLLGQVGISLACCPKGDFRSQPQQMIGSEPPFRPLGIWIKLHCDEKSQQIVMDVSLDSPF